MPGPEELHQFLIWQGLFLPYFIAQGYVLVEASVQFNLSWGKGIEDISGFPDVLCGQEGREEKQRGCG